MLNRRALLASGGAIIGCGICSAAVDAQTYQSRARSGGCWMEAEEASGLLEENEPVISYATGNEPIVLRSGNAVFDRALARSLARMTRLFGVLPGFGYFDEGPGEGPSGNAYATSIVRMDREDGTVLMGRRMLRQLLARQEAPDAAVLAVCAHEYGHIVQFTGGLSSRLLAGQSTVRRLELHADFLAGFFAGVRKRENQNFAAAVVAATQRSYGDYEFNDRNHHGTPQERGDAVAAGYQVGFANRSFQQAVDAGFAHVGA